MENEKLQLGSSHLSQQESKILKARVNLLYDVETFIIFLIIAFLTILTSFLIWIFVPEGSFLVIFSGLIWFLIPLSLLLLNRPNTFAVTSGKIIIKRPMRKPVVIDKEDIMQISEKKNISHYMHWLFRLLNVIIIASFFVQGIMESLQNLKRTFPYYIVISLFLERLALVALFIVLAYNFELIAPYQRTLKVTTRSNLKLLFYTNDPEELTRFLKKET